MSNTKMMLIGLMMLAAVVFGLVMAGISNNADKWRRTKTESESMLPATPVSEQVINDFNQEEWTASTQRDVVNSYRVNDKKLENFSIEWIHGNLRRQGYKVSSILVHGMRSRGGEYSVNGMAEIKNMKQRMRINWVIEVQADHNDGYIVTNSELTEPYFVIK